MSEPNPEYRVDCLMCSGSFSATADTIDELIELIKVHIRDMKKYGNRRHEPYPQTRDEILRSDGFAWTVYRFHPFTKLADACGQIPADKGPDQGSKTGHARRRPRDARKIVA